MMVRSIGATGIEVSVLGLGTVKLGRDQGVKYPAAFRIPDNAEAATLLETAWNLGVRLLDTAPAYGTSEERLGRLLQGQRDRWILSTKAGEEFENGNSRYDFSGNHIRASVERSLRRLNTDRLDIVMIHSNGQDLHILDQTDALSTLLALRDAGHIRAVGMSTKTAEGGVRAIERGCDVIMATYNPWHTDERPALDAAARSGCAVFIKKALASGHGADQLEEALRFVYAHPAVTSVILGTIRPQHLRENAALVERLLGNGA